MNVSRPTLVLAIALLMLLAGMAEACPTCKDGLAAADSQGANIARGYFYSILLMLAMPFTLAGSFGLYVWREYRRQQQTNPNPQPAAEFGGNESVSGEFGLHTGFRQSPS
jgi:heme/copper-type cytochrome/quinol oxidase subunit 2